MMNRSRITTCLCFALAPLVASCVTSGEDAAADPPAADELASSTSAVLGATCYDLSSFVGSFTVGSTVAAADATITFHKFQWSNGTWFAGGVAVVVNSTYADGTPPRELDLNNIMVRVTPDTPAAGVSYRYADLGGEVNLGVNGEHHTVEDLSELDGTEVGGCDVSVTRVATPSGHRGEVLITPHPGVTIEKAGVGGQEFYIDDVCFW